MRNMWKVLLAVGLAAVLNAGPASAYLITFDTLAPDTVIDGVNLGGVTVFSEAGAQTRVVSDGQYGVGWRTPLNAITNFGPNGNFLTGYDLTFVFDAIQPSVSLTGGDMGGEFDQFTVTAFDVNDVVLGQVITPVFGDNDKDGTKMMDFYTVEFNFAGIKKVVVSDAINGGIGIDNVQFCVRATPIPGSILLLGSGLLALLGLRRRA